MALNSIPESHRDLLERPIVVALTTLMPDNQPQSTPVWCMYDGENIIVNTARGRQKDKNLAERKKATVLAIDPNNPYRWLEVRAEVSEMSEEGAEGVIDQLAQQYVGKEKYYGGVAPAEQRDKETRVTVKLKPMRVLVGG